SGKQRGRDDHVEDAERNALLARRSRRPGSCAALDAARCGQEAVSWRGRLRARVPIPESPAFAASSWRTSESKGHRQLYDSSAAFEPDVRTRARRGGRANFGFAALGALGSMTPPGCGRAKPNTPRSARAWRLDSRGRGRKLPPRQENRG